MLEIVIAIIVIWALIVIGTLVRGEIELRDAGDGITQNWFSKSNSESAINQGRSETTIPPSASDMRMIITDKMRAKAQREILSLISESKPLAERRIQRIRDIAISRVGKYCQIGITQGGFIQCYICSVSDTSIQVRCDDRYPSEIFFDTIVSIG